jgi:hypothetical protein
VNLEDAADDNAIGKHVEVVLVPLAGRAGGGGALEERPYASRCCKSRLAY